jgi:hypothetical protein
MPELHAPQRNCDQTMGSGPSRRAVLAGGAAVGAATVFSPAVLRAATPVIKVGHISPVTGPMAGFAEAQGWVLEGIRKYLDKGLLSAITSTDIKTIVGPVKWTGQPVKNVCTTPVVAGQWQKHGDRIDIAIVNSGAYPEIATTSKLLPLG